MAYNPYYGNPYFTQQQGYYSNGAMPDMLNQFKTPYQQIQMPQQPIQQNSPQSQIPIITGGLIYVDNEEQAKNYLVAPNNAVPMFDKNKPLMYVKASDGAGMPNFKKYTIAEYEENDNLVNAPKTPEKHDCKCGDKFATKEQLTALEGKISEITAIVEELKAKPVKKTTKAGEE